MQMNRPPAPRCIRAPAWALAGSALLFGCAMTSEPEPSWIPLVVAQDWQSAPAGADPMAHHTDSGVIACGEQDWHIELDGLEVETTRCNYAAVQQPLRADLVQGDELRVRVWWQTLASPEPVDAHLALLVDDALVWEEHVAIPGPAAARDVVLASPVSAAAGATVTFHLHNHGSNAWNLNELALHAPAAGAQPEE
jgi:hypothetical protein